MIPFQLHNWQRDARNPILPPGEDWFDCTACMNPFVLRQGAEYWMYYAGGDKSGARRICLAIAPINDITSWRRLGPIFDIGVTGSFDDLWCVLPCIHRINNKWHLYYTGRGSRGAGLQAFAGIGLALSDDLLNWTRHPDNPMLGGDGIAGHSGNAGIAGGGRILTLEEDEKPLFRMHYTLATGTPSPDLLVDQQKYAAIAHSHDGFTWFDKRIILGPRLEYDYENAAVIALNVWKTPTRYRAIYAGIGARFGAYSICETVSNDGLHWERGEPAENLTLAPHGDGWESHMVEYPNVIEEEDRLRLFYCGNGYGSTGIGTALADPLD